MVDGITPWGGNIDDPRSDAKKVAAFDPLSLHANFLDDPYPTYKLLRELDPVHRCPDGSYFLTRYDDLAEVYKGADFSSDKAREFGPKYGTDSPLYQHHTTSLVFNDPPLHTRVRSLLSPAFTPRALRDLETDLVALIERLLDAAEEKGHFDLISDYASAIPVEVVGNMLGVPHADRGPLREWSLAILGALEPVTPPQVLERGNNAVAAFAEYLSNLIDDRRKNPDQYADDVMARLIASYPDGDKLRDMELIQNSIFILNAGHETTTNLIGNGVAALFEYPDAFGKLKKIPDLIDTAVEEFLRFESSNQLGNRRVTRDTIVSGIEMPEGTYIHLCIGAANRDPAQFPDPELLDIERRPNRHLAVAGAHACAGMSLARLEGRIAIKHLVERFPKLSRDGLYTRGGRARFRGFLSYPVRVNSEWRCTQVC